MYFTPVLNDFNYSNQANINNKTFYFRNFSFKVISLAVIITNKKFIRPSNIFGWNAYSTTLYWICRIFCQRCCKYAEKLQHRTWNQNRSFRKKQGNHTKKILSSQKRMRSPRIELGTFRSSVWRSPDWAKLATLKM